MCASTTSTRHARSGAVASVAVAMLLAPASAVAQGRDRIDLLLAWQGEGITRLDAGGE